MNKKQINAINNLKKALDSCDKVGLRGGVFEGQFCIWPKDIDVQGLAEKHNDFFDKVDEFGFSIDSKMWLDGGAGV